MSFKLITSDEHSNIYAVTEAGDLLFYHDEARNGNGIWANGGIGQKIGSGWGNFLRIIAGGDGIIYAVDLSGDLLFYRDEAQNGTAQWSFDGAGQKIGSSFDSFIYLFYGGDGIIYAIDKNGDLFYYKDEVRNGTFGWSFNGIGQKIGSGWNNFRHVISGGDGIIYAVTADGKLLYYRDEARNGNGVWSNGGIGQQIGQGWAFFPMIFYGGDGIIYAITADGFLLFYRDEARNGNGVWANGGVGRQIGQGWLISSKLSNVQGYCIPYSAAPGETIAFKISAHVNYRVAYVRLKTNNENNCIPLTGEDAKTAMPQTTPPNSYEIGCGWETVFSLQIPANWQSGIYAAQCTDDDGGISHIVFIVNPSINKRNKIAVLASTNTWNAYNNWGGLSKYDNAVFGSFERPSVTTSPIDDGIISHTTRGGLWILGWLEDAGYSVDVYSDYDFHRGIQNIGDYKAIILSTHPEYWTVEMLDHLEAYIATGGSLFYLGGNGIFERCVFANNDSALQFWGGDPSLGRDRNYFRNMIPPRPERNILGIAFLYNNSDPGACKPAPFKIEFANHRFFAGTTGPSGNRLANGDLIGEIGLNRPGGSDPSFGGASGWEMDTSENGQSQNVTVTAWLGDDRGTAPSNIQILARGINVPVNGLHTAQITYYDTAFGGFVFAAGSITFGGSLAVDSNLQTILSNALSECLSR